MPTKGRPINGSRLNPMPPPDSDGTGRVGGGAMRTFSTGATRNGDVGKFDFDGFLSPYALEAFARYMDRNRKQADGSIRDSDNWQKGIPLGAYRKSAWRHFFEFWKFARAGKVDQEIEDALCALIFNAQGYLHEIVKARDPLADQSASRAAASVASRRTALCRR